MGKWLCENVFCSMREICSNWTNCLNCHYRVKFMNFALNNTTPKKTKWGRALLKQGEDTSKED